MPVSATTFSSTHQPPSDRPARGKAYHTIIREAIEAETGKDINAFWRTVVKKALGEDGAPYLKMLMDRLTPTLKAHMMTVSIDFPINGSAIEQAQAVLTAVAQGTLPLDYAGPMLAMIQLIDAAKGGTLGNSGLDLASLYQGPDGLKAATDFAKQIAALQPKPQVIDVTPTQQQQAQAQEPITVALAREAATIDAEAANVTNLIDAAADRLAAIYPANTPVSIYNGIANLINAREQAKEATR